jgi:hypothetical protein
MSQGCKFRLVIVDPTDDNLMQSLEAFTKNDAKDIRANIDVFNSNLKYIRADMKAKHPGVNADDLLQVRIINYPPTMSFLMVDGSTPKGSIYADLLLYMEDTECRPTWHVPYGSNWFYEMRRVCENTWTHAKDYKPKE